MGAKPVWLAYLAVADVDAMARRIEAAGGRIYQPAKDIPGVGRFAAAGDPQGAPFVVFRGSAAVDPGPTPMGATGFINWHELHTTDREGGFAFYAGLFGWTKADAVDMGPMGTYQMFATQGLMAGGMMQQEGRPFWLYYINVEAIDAAVARVAAGGGKLLSGPQQVPGGSWVAQCLDPQGVKFAVVSQQR
jgi:predicted enzyme related to lactoylglutathione lyase